MLQQINNCLITSDNLKVYFRQMQQGISVVQSKKDLREFIYLPEKIHSAHANWVPPIYADEWKFYKPRFNKSLSTSETILMLAYEDGKPVGRIMGIINRSYNELRKEKTARFFNFDCFDDKNISHLLISSIEKWAKDKGMTHLIGPFGFSDKDPQGLQVEGFEHIPVIATATNLPYLQNLVEGEGFEKHTDCVVYRLPIPQQIPAIYQRVYERLIRSKKFHLVEFRSRSELKPFIVPVLRLVNETYRSLFGFIPMDEEEMFQFADKYLPILNPAFTKLVTDSENMPVAFVIASPDMSKGIIKAKGKLFPFGFIHILSSAKKSRQLDLFLGAVKEQYQGSGVTALLGVSLFRSALEKGLEYIDSHLILETNKPMRDVMERLGAVIYKRYRIYQKKLKTD